MSQAKQSKAKKAAEGGVTKTQYRDIPNSRLYNALRELDLRVEQYSNRRKAEICDMSYELDLSLRCLRLQLHNTHSNQGSTDPANPPSWSFYIHGTFIDQSQLSAGPSTSAGPQPLTAAPPAGGAQQQKGAAGADRNWTAAMSSVQIRIEDPARPDEPAEIMRWERNRHVGLHREQIEIHRTGTTPARIFVTMVRDFAPEYFKVTGMLAEKLQLTRGTRGGISRALQRYAEAHSTKDASDPSFLHADADLQALTGEQRIDAAALNKCINPYLQHLEPVALQYTVQLDGASPCTPACYDIEVAWALKPALLKLPPVLERLDIKAELDAKDEAIHELLATLRQAQRRRRFLLAYATDPASFIRRLIAASGREIRTRSGGAYVQLPPSEHFKQPWAQEAACWHLHHLETEEKKRQDKAQQAQQQAQQLRPTQVQRP